MKIGDVPDALFQAIIYLEKLISSDSHVLIEFIPEWNSVRNKLKNNIEAMHYLRDAVTGYNYARTWSYIDNRARNAIAKCLASVENTEEMLEHFAKTVPDNYKYEPKMICKILRECRNARTAAVPAVPS